MKRVLFLYNPVSGTGLVKRRMFDIVDFYNKYDCLVTLCPFKKFTEYGDELFSDEEALQQFDYLVVSGGDGTLSNFLSYISNYDFDFPAGYVPAGSTNDYATSIGISSELYSALRTTITGQEKSIDIGRFNDKEFLYVAAFGIFTKVVYSTSQDIKNVMGHAAYLLEGIKILSELQSYNLTMTIDGEELSGSFIVGIVSNSLSIGGYTTLIQNDVLMDDGLFEVLFIRTPKSINGLNKIVKVLLSDSPIESDDVIIRKAKSVHIMHEKETDWTLDGEYGGAHTEVNISVIGNKFRIIV